MNSRSGLSPKTLSSTLLIAILTQPGCETSSTYNLVDGTRTPKESWFQFKAEKEQLEPQDQRLREAEYLARPK